MSGRPCHVNLNLLAITYLNQHPHCLNKKKKTFHVPLRRKKNYTYYCLYTMQDSNGAQPPRSLQEKIPPRTILYLHHARVKHFWEPLRAVCNVQLLPMITSLRRGASRLRPRARATASSWTRPEESVCI